MAWRSGGSDEPTVELLGDDAPPATPGTTSERERSWWPVWVGAAALAIVGFLALVGSGGGSDDPVADDGPVSIEEEEAADTTSPNTTEAAADPPRATTTTEAEPVVVDNAAAVAELGLSGHLFVWVQRSLYRLDLSTAEWERFEAPSTSNDPWSSELVATEAGLLLNNHGELVSADIEGNEIDSRFGGYSGPGSSTLAAGRLWSLGEYNSESITVYSLDATGTWEPAFELPVTAQFGPQRMIGAADRLLVSVFSGGIYDLLTPGFPRVADGFAFAGNEEFLLAFECLDALTSCTLIRRDAQTFDVIDVVDNPDVNGGFVFGGPNGWSPDLRFWIDPWGNGSILDLETGVTQRIPVKNAPDAAVAWTSDSRYLVTIFDEQIRFYDPVSGDHITVAPHPDMNPRLNGRLLHRPAG